MLYIIVYETTDQYKLFIIWKYEMYVNIQPRSDQFGNVIKAIIQIKVEPYILS